MAAVVNVNKNSNEYYLHEVALETKKEATSVFKTGTNNVRTPSTNVTSIQILLNKINDVKSNSKYSTKLNSEGEQLSEGQAEYFKDSKVRDEDGNLLKVYHGTSEDFTVFDRTKGRHNIDIQGSFFSPWELDAQGYGENVKAYYLNITNPASEQMGYKALRMFQGQNNAGVKAREYLESLGYDGVNNGNEEYIAFNSNQIKLADNLNPTDNEDVRYSDKNMDFGVTQPEINDFVENAFVNKPNNQSYLKFANVSEKLYNDIKSLFPDVNKYTHALRDNDIRHIRNSHGKYTNEKYPVLETDIELIPYIVKNYDKVFYADHNGKRGIYYVKVMSNNVVYYLEQATNKYGNENLLINKQMIKSSLNEIPNLKALKNEILKNRLNLNF